MKVGLLRRVALGQLPAWLAPGKGPLAEAPAQAIRRLGFTRARGDTYYNILETWE